MKACARRGVTAKKKVAAGGGENVSQATQWHICMNFAREANIYNAIMYAPIYCPGGICVAAAEVCWQSRALPMKARRERNYNVSSTRQLVKAA